MRLAVVNSALVKVYFPCCKADVQYSVELGYYMGFIEDILQDNNTIIVLGDFNFECDMSNSGCKQCVDMFDNYSILNCDDLCESLDRVTYYNDSLGQSSFIDHFFVSRNLKLQISKLSKYDSGANLSDHRPLIGIFTFNSHSVRGLTILKNLCLSLNIMRGDWISHT